MVVAWIRERLNFHSSSRDYTDNFRAACKTDLNQLSLYDQQYNSGCCGFADRIEVCPIDGKTYKLGFNYGH